MRAYLCTYVRYVSVTKKKNQGFKGAIVGNAVDGLKKWVDRSPSRHMIHRYAHVCSRMLTYADVC